MNVHLGRTALAAAFLASLGGVALADELNPQPLPPGLHAVGRLASGSPACVSGQHLLLGATRTPAAPGSYKLADGSIIVVGGKGTITSSTSALVNRFISPGSRSMLNPQPLPP